MSGREPEPISAFFPSIDRNLMRDLDRHLRRAAPVDEPPAEPEPTPIPPPTAQMPGRPSTADILGAVEQAAASMSEMTQRIADLENRHFELEAMNEQLKSKLGELLQLQQSAEASARAERDRADRAEQIAAQHLSRTQELELDLQQALGDLTRVAEAITGTLGSGRRR